MSDTVSSEREGQTAGSRLRSTRELKGLSLEDVVRVTRISKGYLSALEEDNYTRLPSDVYARGFLRIYAQFLGIEEQEILSLYPQDSALVEPHHEPEMGACESTVADISPDTRQMRLWYLAVFCALIAVGVLFLRMNDGPPARKADNPVSLPPLMKPASSSLVPQITAVPDEKPSPISPPEIIERPSPPVSREKGIVLKMKALEDAFLVVTIDDMISQQYDLKAGDIIEWKAEKVFSLDLDNAGGVEAELNGKILKPFGEKGMSAHVVLKADAERDETAP
jgi:transcriptional regulator with XRE-family HTH domain